MPRTLFLITITFTSLLAYATVYGEEGLANSIVFVQREGEVLQERVGNWFGIIGPAGMPEAVVARLNDEIVKASRDKTVIERLTENGTIIATTTPQEMATIMRDEAANISELIKELGLQVR